MEHWFGGRSIQNVLGLAVKRWTRKIRKKRRIFFIAVLN